MPNATAHLYWIVQENNTPAASKRALIVDFVAKKKNALRFNVDQASYIAQEAAWDSTRNLFSMSIFKLRANNLPSKVSGDTVEPLDLEEEDVLGEPMVFVYNPNHQACLLYYNHYGPRHTAVKQCLEKVGITGPLIAMPAIETEALKKLGKNPICRALEYTVIVSNAQKNAISAAPTIKQSVEIGRELEGERVSVRVTMGHQKGRLGITRAILGLFSRNEAGCIDSAKVDYKRSEGSPTETLDLFEDRITRDFQTELLNRGLDRARCLASLKTHYADLTKEIVKQNRE